jgi:ParB family chromosome partitioning protein
MHPKDEYSNSIFWIDIDKIHPNPYQPRREFDQDRLSDLAESIRQYGVLQPLVVTRKEDKKVDGGLSVSYELIAGERRLRASRIAGVTQVPAVIRNVADNSRVKLELAIIENVQREELNAVERARAFHQLAEEFNFKHTQIADRIHKSREYVSNTLRLLALPKEILDAVSEGKLSEGHTRPLLMLNDRPEEQNTLFREIMLKKLSVRDAEGIARRIALDKVRKKDMTTHPETVQLEESLTEKLGTRVQIEHKEVGGKITIAFDSETDLQVIIEKIMHEQAAQKAAASGMVPSAPLSAPATPESMVPEIPPLAEVMPVTHEAHLPEELPASDVANFLAKQFAETPSAHARKEISLDALGNEIAGMSASVPPSTASSEKEKEEDLYNIQNFAV